MLAFLIKKLLVKKSSVCVEEAEVQQYIGEVPALGGEVEDERSEMRMLTL